MSRSTFEFTVPSKTPDEIMEAAGKFLTSNDFTLKDVKGESLYQRGKDIGEGMLPPQRITLAVADNKVKLEAFVVNITGEAHLKGIFGIAAKRPLKKTVDELINALGGTGVVSS